MQFIYPAVFSKREDGGYRGYFPDLEQCYAEGDTLDEALNSAIEEARTRRLGRVRSEIPGTCANSQETGVE